MSANSANSRTPDLPCAARKVVYGTIYVVGKVLRCRATVKSVLICALLQTEVAQPSIRRT